jgi:hypothetical protein
LLPFHEIPSGVNVMRSGYVACVVDDLACLYSDTILMVDDGGKMDQRRPGRTGDSNSTLEGVRDPVDSSAKEAARRAVIAAFQAHWANLVARLERGEAVAGEQHDAFFALEERDRSRLAQRFYTLERALKFAALSDEQAAEQLAAWLDDVTGLVDFDIDEPGDGLKQRDRLVRSEYVCLVRDGGIVSFAVPYPDDVLYDDIYELTASGVSPGGQVLLYKSTGERFSDEELELAMPALVKHVEGNAAADGERVDVSVELHDDDCAILVDVWVIDDDEDEDEDEEELAGGDVEEDDRDDGRGGGERGVQT